jgi:hypothetical protein
MQMPGLPLVSEAEFLGWRAADGGAFGRARLKLLGREGPLADRLLIHRVERADGSLETVYLGNPEFARSASVEDADCKVSAGCCTLRPAYARGSRIYLARPLGDPPASPVEIGWETMRRMDRTKFARADWRGDLEFHGLFRSILRRHCIREQQTHLAWGASTDELGEGFEGDPPAGAVESADSAFESDEVRQHYIRELAKFSVLLLHRKQRAAAETTFAVIRCLNQQAPDWETDHDLFWAEVGDLLHAEPSVLYQRKRRFFNLLIEMREDLSGLLVARAGRLLAAEAGADVADCRLHARNLPEHAGALNAVADFLLSNVAAQAAVKNRPLDSIRQAGVSGLLGRRGGVRAWPPSGAGFSEFCGQCGLPADGAMGAIEKAAEALASQKPVPRRLLHMLNEMFEDRPVEVDSGERVTT